MASQIINLAIFYSTVYSSADKKNQSSASLAFVWWPVTGEFPTQRASNAENVPFDDVIMSFHILRLDDFTKYHSSPTHKAAVQ